MSTSPGESLTPRARKAWTGEDDESRGERKDATANAGFLAKYSRWSHDRPCLVFTSVFMAIIAISAVVALANLAEFNTDAGDKVRPGSSPDAMPEKAARGKSADPSSSSAPRAFFVRRASAFAPFFVSASDAVARLLRPYALDE